MEKGLQEVYNRISKEIEDVDCKGQKLQTNDLIAISDQYENNLNNGGLTLYKLGFINGQKQLYNQLKSQLPTVLLHRLTIKNQSKISQTNNIEHH